MPAVSVADGARNANCREINMFIFLEKGESGGKAAKSEGTLLVSFKQIFKDDLKKHYLWQVRDTIYLQYVLF